MGKAVGPIVTHETTLRNLLGIRQEIILDPVVPALLGLAIRESLKKALGWIILNHFVRTLTRLSTLDS